MLESFTLSERRACAPHALSSAAYKKLRIRMMSCTCRSKRMRFAMKIADYAIPSSGELCKDTMLNTSIV
jgi:hypothetical protein